jgi:uncharacterized protein (TIGR02147 family)
MANIFTFTDYRAFLRRHYEEQKGKDPKYSHRYFSAKAGISSSGFFADVLSGKRNLTPALIFK